MATYRATGEAPPSVSAGRVRGVLDLCVLAVLAEEPMHGYGVARALARAGIGEVKGGTLYPLLGRLEAQGWLHANWEPSGAGPPRKRYALSDTGRDHLAVEGGAWLTLADRAGDLIRASLQTGTGTEARR